VNRATLRTLVLPAVILVAIAVAVGLFAGLSTTHEAAAEGAVVQNMGHNPPTGDAATCTIATADSDGVIAAVVNGGVPVVVIENNRWLKLVCKGDVVNESGEGQSYDFAAIPAICNIISPKDPAVSYETTDAHATVSASGESTLECSFDLSTLP
jgi:hypothetical protein